MKRTGGLIVSEDEADTFGLSFVAGLLALLAAGIGGVRYWVELGPTWGWIALGLGAFACGIALVKIVTTRLRDFPDIMSALGTLVMGAGAIAGMFVPIAPAIGFGVWLAGWIIGIVMFETQ
jgi:hypothetical protein